MQAYFNLCVAGKKMCFTIEITVTLEQSKNNIFFGTKVYLEVLGNWNRKAASGRNNGKSLTKVIMFGFYSAMLICNMVGSFTTVPLNDQNTLIEQPLWLKPYNRVWKNVLRSISLWTFILKPVNWDYMFLDKLYYLHL